MDEGAGPLTPLHPNHVKALRLSGLVVAVPLMLASIVVALVSLLAEGNSGPALVALALLGLVAWLVVFLPWRRYSARGFAMQSDRLRVVKGILFRKDTVVPFSRVQHIDLERGPIERYYGLATLVLHTAGTHNASVHLPGLGEDDAVAMRETIRERIAAAQ